MALTLKETSVRWLGIVLMFLGALVGGAGGYALAVVVQPGDWLVGRDEVVNTNNERVVVSSYGSTWYDSGLRITTTAPDGQAVFIGTANPIDVDDYTAGVARVEITSMAPLRRVETSAHQGAKDLPAEPLGLDFWIDRHYGQGAQSLVTGDAAVPAQVMVVAAAGQPISVRVDHVVAGLRRALFGVVGAGAGLLLIGLALLVVGIVRRKRPQPPAPAPTPMPPLLMAPPPTPPASPLMRWAAGVLAASMVFATTGCTLPRTPVAVQVIPRAEVRKVPLPKESITPVTLDLEKRMNAARAASSPPTYSTEAWRTVYGEVALASRTFGTELAKATGDTWNGGACGLVIADVYGDRQVAYPMTTTALLKWGCRTKLEAYFTVLTRPHSYDQWQITAEVPADAGAALPKGSQDAVTADDKQRAGRLISAASDATKEGDPSNFSELVKTIYAAINPLADKADVSVSVAAPDHATYPTSAIVAKTESGMILMFSMVVTVTTNAKPGYYVSWAPPLDQLLNQPGHRQSVTRRYVGMWAVTFDGDTPKVLGHAQPPIH